MSDWYRGRRDEDPGRDRSEGRSRRDFGESDRWRGQGQRENEQRNFEERRADPDQGGEADYRRRQAYGPSERDEPRYGQVDYRDRQRYDEPRRWSGQPDRGERGGGIGLNPTLERIAGGYADHIWRSDMPAGEHRGRGPKNYTRSDDRIREDVSERLSDDSWLDASEIEVRVANCEVILTGAVQSRDDKRRAEDLAEQVSGVKHVQNNLRVEPRSPQFPGGVPPVT